MRYRESSSIDRFFETPAHERPLLDLNIPISSALPEYLQRVGSGATRWVDLIIGFAMDDARRQAVAPSRISDELESGDLLLRAFFFVRSSVQESAQPDMLRYGYDSDALLIGSLAARLSVLSISGGEPFSGPPFSVQYRKEGGAYRLARSVHIIAPFGAERLHLTEADIPPDYVLTEQNAHHDGYLGVPNELRAVAALVTYADMVERELDAGRMTVRTTIESARFGEIRGSGPE